MTCVPHHSKWQSRKEFVRWRPGSHPFPAVSLSCPYLHPPLSPGPGPGPYPGPSPSPSPKESGVLTAPFPFLRPFARLPAIAPSWRGSRTEGSRILCVAATRVNKQLSLEDSADTLRGSYRAQAAKTSRRIPGESSAASIWLEPYLAGSGRAAEAPGPAAI